jgi:hypothetical protein
MAGPMTARYFANIGPAKGPVRYRDVPCAIGILDAPDHPMPIGMALGVGWNPGGLAVWRLTVRGADVRGWWVIIDRRFVVVDGDPA